LKNKKYPAVKSETTRICSFSVTKKLFLSNKMEYSSLKIISSLSWGRCEEYIMDASVMNIQRQPTQHVHPPVLFYNDPSAGTGYHPTSQHQTQHMHTLALPPATQSPDLSSNAGWLNKESL
jgi:hypothetical protein